jgi:hypothetical protein
VRDIVRSRHVVAVSIAATWRPEDSQRAQNDAALAAVISPLDGAATCMGRRTVPTMNAGGCASYQPGVGGSGSASRKSWVGAKNELPVTDVEKSRMRS